MILKTILLNVFPWGVIILLWWLLTVLIKSTGNAFYAAAIYAPTDKEKNYLSRKSVLYGNSDARFIYALSAPNRFSNRKPLEIFKIKGVPCVFYSFYYASRYNTLLSASQSEFSRNVLDFKDGKFDGINFFQKGLDILKPVDGTVIMFMPCSAWWKYWIRFRHISDYIEKSCPNIINGFGYYKYLGERVCLHTTRNRKNATIERNFEITQDLSGKHVILIDDVITSGKSLTSQKKEIENKGGKVVGAIFLASTFRMPSRFRSFFSALNENFTGEKYDSDFNNMSTPKHGKHTYIHKNKNLRHEYNTPKTDKEFLEPDRVIILADNRMIFCYNHYNRSKRMYYYTAIHIPSDNKQAKNIYDHLEEIIEADKHRDPTDFELSLITGDYDHLYPTD